MTHKLFSSQTTDAEELVEECMCDPRNFGLDPRRLTLLAT